MTFKQQTLIFKLQEQALSWKQNNLKRFKIQFCHQTMHLKPNPQDNGVISKQFLKKLCRSDFKQYYSTPSLNDILYLHYKGFQKIDNLQEFTGLKVIYFQGNAIKKIENLQKLVNLRCLYLQENLVREISGLECLTNLVNLNLSDNMIEKVAGLATLQRLSTLQLKRNRIGADGLSDVIGLLQCQSISALDLSDNKIQTQEVVTQVLQKMTNLSVVYLQNNGFNKKISHYRKTLINKIPNLKYIDDKPVFQDQKRFSEAWGRGGLEEERKQRALYKKQEQQKQIRQHEQFRAMIDRYKNQAKNKKEQSEQSSDNLSESQGQSLQTYNTPQQSSKQSSERMSDNNTQSQSEVVNAEKQDTKPQKQQKEAQITQTQGINSNPSEKLSEKVKTQQKQRQNDKEEVKEKEEQKKDSSKYLDQLD